MKKSKYKIAVLVIIAVTVILNLIAFSKEFCDRYTVTVYRGLNAAIGSLTGRTSIIIGELLMYVGAALVVLFLVFGIVRLILFKKKAFAKFFKGYAKTFLIILLLVLLVYTTNWFIPIRGNVLVVSDNTRTEYTVAELKAVRNLAVSKLNEIAEKIPRDENGIVITDYSQEEIFAIMEARADEFPKLAGHYSPAKEAYCSAVLDMMGIGGYNYIYTMEPTVNRYMSALYMPTAIAHELCHHKGYYYENEATFISAIVLAESDNLYFQYCGWFEIYRYVDDEVWEYDDYDLMWSDRVSADYLYAYEQAELMYEAEVNETVHEVLSEPAGEIADKGWEIQGEILQENIYSGMVLMLLQYYYEQ
ncbi:MAG: DUF3810 domain-containing protein [Lachnospiraceae bacterium]|nr:DUF3810 domain-containing protein [Lachnospiraceae bacterium]